jgi:hypothetical protein
VTHFPGYFDFKVPFLHFALMLLALSVSACTESASTSDADAVVLNSVDFLTADSRTAGIQEAIDALPPEGGVVYLPAGRHEISRIIQLRSGIYLRGEGDHSVITRRHPVFLAPLTDPGLTGETEIEVEDSSGFLVGDAICIRSPESNGWWSTHTIVTGISSNTITIADELTHDYLPEEEALAMNLFPALYAIDSRDIRIENLFIDGGIEDKDRELLPVEFTLSAVHFRAVSDCAVIGVHVKDYPGDGISIQIGDNATVSNCLSEYNIGHGFHPGTGLSSGAWINNVGRHNGWDGFFFCHRVRHSIISGNRFHDNGWNGIGNLGLGGEGGDRYNVVSGNFCFNNGKSGIECLEGGNNTVVNNVCSNNSKSEPGRWPGILVDKTFNTIVSNNRCFDFHEKESEKTQGNGILVVGDSRDNIISGNIITGHPKDGIAGDALGRSTVTNNLVKKTHEPVGM